MCRNRNIALLVLACIGFGENVAAAEWGLKGTLDQALQYNDNIAFRTIQKSSVVGYLLAPSLEATRKTEVLDIGFSGKGDIRRYDDSRWDCDNYNLGLNNDYRTQRSIFSLKGGYSVSCSYAQQINDTGLLAPNSQSKNYKIGPSWTWQWTSLDQLTLNPSYSKTSYSNPSGGVISSTGLNFSGNETYSINLGGNHEWSKRLSLSEKLLFSNIQYTGSNALAQNLFGFQLGAKYKIDPNWAASANGGPMWVDTQQNSTSATSGQNTSLSLGSIAAINLSYSGQSTQFSTGFSNSIDPSAIGQTLQTSSIFASYSYRLTQRLLLDITSSYSRAESIGGHSSNIPNNQFKRNYYTVAPTIAWELAQSWQLKGSYVYRWQDYKNDNNFQNLNVGTSESNAVMLSLGYSWDGIQISR
ncbi:MAG: hypothetical protein ACXV8U_23415 [Methylobacter sp.]